MPRKTRNNTGQQKWMRVEDLLRKDFPHVFSFMDNSSDVREIRFKWQDDGTVLAIAKGYDSDGGPSVCFGSGYDFILAFMSIDASIQGDNWRFDKPWKPG